MAYEKNADIHIIGVAAQTTLNNNLLLTSAGSGSIDKLGLRSIALSITASAGVSAGVITFEESNDNTNWVILPLYDDAVANTNPLSNYTIAASSTRFFSGPVVRRYLRIRISTAVVGGTVQAFATLSPASYTADTLTIAQATAANLNTTSTGVLTAVTPGVAAANLGKAEDAVHSSGDTGVFAMGVRRDAKATASSATGDYEGLQLDGDGALYVNNQYVSNKGRGLSIFKTTALTNVAQTVKATAGNIHGFNFINVNALPIYVKIFNVVIGSITVGTTVPDRTLVIPAQDSAGNPGSVVLADDDSSFFFGSAALSVLASSVLAQTGSQTAPTTPIYAEVIYST